MSWDWIGNIEPLEATPGLPTVRVHQDGPALQLTHPNRRDPEIMSPRFAETQEGWIAQAGIFFPDVVPRLYAFVSKAVILLRSSR